MAKAFTLTRHICPRNCYSSCSMLGYTVNGRLTKIVGDDMHGYTKGKLCPKGYNYLSHVYHPERLKYPMIQQKRGSGDWSRITWEEAIEIICRKMIELYDRYGTNLSVALNKYSGNFGVLHNSIEGFFNSLGQTSRAIGSPCWSSGLDANIYDFGNNKSSSPKQLANADTIILWGCNPVWTSIHSITYLYEAQKNGARIISIDPIYTPTAKKADIYMQINPGTDGALALAIAKYIYDKSLVDWSFVENYTYGYEHFAKYIETLRMEDLLQECGLSLHAVERIVDHFSDKKKVMIWAGFGLQRNLNGGQNIRAINALMAMTGNIGKDGTGVLYANLGYEVFANQITNYYNLGFNEVNAVRPIHMNDFARSLEETADPPIKMLWIACRNLLSQNPDQHLLEKVLHNLELIVTVDHFLTPTSSMSDLVLPATTNFEEWDIVVSYWHHWIGINEPAIKPYYESKSDLEIAQMLSRRLNELRPGFSTFPFDKPVEDFIEDEFTDESYRLLGIENWQDLLSGPKKLDIPEIAWEDKKFDTPSEKFEFFSENAIKNGKSPIANYNFLYVDQFDGQFLLLTHHHQFKLNSQFSNLKIAQGLEKEQIVYIHPSSAEKMKINNDSRVLVFNEYGEIKLKCLHSIEVHPAILLIHADYKLINKLIAFTPTDMGEVSSGFEGMAFNSIYAQIKNLEDY